MEQKNGLNRRDFIRKSVVSGTAISVIPAHVLGGTHGVAPSDKLNAALIGCGNMGLGFLNRWVQNPELQMISVCDVNKESADYPVFSRVSGEGELGFVGGYEVGRRTVNEAYAKNSGKGKYKGCSAYTDFRELIAKENDLDAVFIMTPDHLHTHISLAAMKNGLKVATHKPISNFMYETRLTCDTAKQIGVPTHCFFFQDPPGLRTIMEILKLGIIGKVKEVHRWTNRPVWPQGSPNLPTNNPPIPEGFDWQLWLGPSVDRPYSPDYTHRLFRGWYEFGGGVLADMGHYGLWRDWRVLDLGMPVSAKGNSSFCCEVRNFRSTPIVNEVTYPQASVIQYKVPVNGKSELVDVFWYDGGMMPRTPGALEKKGEELSSEGGVMFIGEDGIVLTAAGGYKDLQILGVNDSDEVAALSQIQEGTWTDNNDAEMIKAFKGGEASRGDFMHAQTIAETICLGNLAVRSRRKLEWDNENMKVTNFDEANRFLHREYRPGWEL